MTIEELIVHGKKYISSVEAKMILSRVTGYDTLNLLNHLGEKIEVEKVEQYKNLIQARLNNKPVQYILGTTNFYGIELVVNENVLIPRFETEELVENTKELIGTIFPKDKDLKILDLCCGSGAIGIKIKKMFPQYNVTISDISIKALEVAKINCKRLDADIEILESDLFSNIKDKFDVIISNPPYIAEDEEIDLIVKDNEPNIALYGGKDGLDFYEKILKNILFYLNDKYLIAFEIGYLQKEAIIEMTNMFLKNVDIICKKDLSGKDRMIFITNIR